MTDADATVRRDAAKAAGRSGSGAAALMDKLALLLKDSDESTRVAALQAVALLGPIAASAAPAVVPLLDDTNTCIDAADALGRIGPRARPVPKRLVEMLSSDQTAIQWAAVRAMAQIGGKEAHPAVDFIVGKMRGATEINLYNMMIYLALLGPDAADAIPAAQNSGLAQPIIPSATVWAMRADRFPWQSDTRAACAALAAGAAWRRRLGGGGPGGAGLDLNTTMYEAYIRELGERLRPLALKLGAKDCGWNRRRRSNLGLQIAELRAGGERQQAVGVSGGQQILPRASGRLWRWATWARRRSRQKTRFRWRWAKRRRSRSGTSWSGVCAKSRLDSQVRRIPCRRISWRPCPREWCPLWQ